jgi:hypothetical protein
MHNAAAEDEFNLYPSAYSPQYLGFAVDNNWGMRRALVSHDAIVYLASFPDSTRI